jgi:hypothetical protein
MISNAASRALARALKGKKSDKTIRAAVEKIRKQYSVTPIDLVDGMKAVAHTLYPND